MDMDVPLDFDQLDFPMQNQIKFCLFWFSLPTFLMVLLVVIVLTL